jgi:ABC-type Fe3+/spermidine/putrescine transport system ATPase subunit
MFGGRIHQLAPPAEIYHRPQTWMVAEFIGLTTFIEGRITGEDGDLLVLDTALGVLRCAHPERAAAASGRLPPDGPPAAAPRAGDAKPERLIAVRPEAIQLAAPGGSASRWANRLRGVVRARAFLGNLVDYRIEVAPGLLLRVQGDPHAPFAVGDAVEATFPPAATWSVPAREEPVA